MNCFCFNSSSVYYYVLLVPVQYYTITRDSAYVLKHGLDDDTAPAAGAEPHQLEEDARYLLEQESNEGLVELLRDASLSLIHAEDLEFLRRIGCGGFGMVCDDLYSFTKRAWFCRGGLFGAVEWNLDCMQEALGVCS